MAKIKREDLNTLSDEDLRQRLADDTERSQKLRFNHAVNPLDSPMDIRVVRREIARLKTEIKQRKMAQAK